ncbi:MAG: deoxyribonuclease IV [Cellulomonadaceae bacterium]|jgi:deoxyribonuclease-4|nr:deoxyribonuclease IV [Cellulomonadaceae bacterium]
MSLRIGCHFPIENVVAEAEAVGATAAQVFLGDPQKWKVGEVAFPGGNEGLKAAATAADIMLFVHCPYIMNVASLSNRTRIPSRNLLKATISGAAKIGAKGVVVHGGHLKDDEDLVAGFINWRKAIDDIDPKVKVLIENTAGGQNAMCRELPQIEWLWQAISTSPNGKHVGFVLDTCHAWAAGLDLETVVSDITAITGKIDLVHLNDSRDGAGSGADRHAPLGKGQIPPDLLVQIVKEAKAPVIIETHGDPSTEIAWLKERL